MSTSMKVGMCLIGKNEQSGLTEGMVGDKMRNRLLGALTVKLKCLSYKEMIYEQRHKMKAN